MPPATRSTWSARARPTSTWRRSRTWMRAPCRTCRSCSSPGRTARSAPGPARSTWSAWAEVLVGYAPYLARVPPRRGQERRASDNRVELERAREALELALAGARVAVVSSGDPGIFAMAAAVYEAIEEGGARFAGVSV